MTPPIGIATSKPSACSRFVDGTKNNPDGPSNSRLHTSSNCRSENSGQVAISSLSALWLRTLPSITRLELANAIFEYLEIFHNRRRRHSALGMLTPADYENLYHQQRVAAWVPDAEQAPPPSVPDNVGEPADQEWLVNPYARGGRPQQVALSLYVPQWDRIEEQCADLQAQGVRDATITRWLLAVLHFRAPVETDAAGLLLRRWIRLETDEAGPYSGLSKEARGVRFYETLWERQRGVVTELRRGAGYGRPTFASWSTAVVELAGPKTAVEARELIRELRVLLAGDPA